MYRILLDGDIFCDSRVEDLVLIDPVVDLEVNKAGSFKFTIPPAHPFYDSINERTSIIEVYRDDETEPIFEGVAVSVTDDFYKQRTVECEGSLSFLNDSILRPQRYQNLTVRQLLESYISQHNAQVDSFKQFTVGQVTVNNSENVYRYTNYQSTLKEISEDLIDNYGGYIRIRHNNGVRYLDYLADSPNTNSQIIKLGDNLIDFNSNLDTLDLITGIIPLGARLEESSVEGLEERVTIKSVNNGSDYLLSSAADTYGRVFGTVTWDDVNEPGILKTKGQAYLNEAQFADVYVEARAVDLHLDDDDIESFKLLDNIRVLSAPHGLDRNFMITKLSLNLNAPDRDTLTLGKDEKLSMSARTIQDNNSILKKIEEIKPSQILESAKENATALITRASNGYVTTTYNEDGSTKEILVMDTNDIETATKVWRWNVNGFGYSSNGYSGPYGTAITMDGAINCDYLNGGKIYGQTIEGSSITSNDPSTEWKLTMYDGALTTYDGDGDLGLLIMGGSILIHAFDDSNINAGRVESIYMDEPNNYYISIHSQQESLGVLIGIEDENHKYIPSFAARQDTDISYVYGASIYEIIRGETFSRFAAESSGTTIRGNSDDSYLDIADNDLIFYRKRSNGLFSKTIVSNGSRTAIYSPNGNNCFVADNDNSLVSTPLGSGYGMFGIGHYLGMFWSGSSLSCYIDAVDQAHRFSFTGSLSDRRAKKEIATIDNDLINAIGKVDLVQFKYNDTTIYNSTSTRYGVVAQDVLEALEDVPVGNQGIVFSDGMEDEDSLYNVNYTDFLIARVAYDEQRIDKLEQMVADLTEQIKELKESRNE